MAKLRDRIPGGDVGNHMESNGNLVRWGAQSASLGELREILLSAQKGQIDGVNDRGQSALILASAAGRTEHCDLLLENGADTEIQDEHGYSALMHAASRGHFTTVELLLARGARTNCTSRFGVTALMDAAAEGHHRVVELLLDAGADSMLEAHSGERADHFARRAGHFYIARILQKEVLEAER